MVKKAETNFEGDVIDGVSRDGNILYFSARPDTVYAYEMEKHMMLWKNSTGESLASPPFLGRESVYVTGEGGILFAIGKNGAELWRRQFSSSVTSSVCESEGGVIAGMETGEVLAMNAQTGDLLWSFSSGAPVRSNIMCSQGKILFGNDEGGLFALDNRGRLTGRFQAEGPIGKNLEVFGSTIFFGTEDRYFYALNLAKLKKKWRRSLGGPVRVPPAGDGRNLFVSCWNGVLYCLSQKSGSVVWWKPLPSRSMYRPELVDNRMLATSFSPRLVGYLKKSGESTGYFIADSEIRANPVWKGPDVLIAVFDYSTGHGLLQHLEKEVSVRIDPSVQSPQLTGVNVDLNVTAVGFHLAQFEFFIKQGEERTVLQDFSAQNTYSWFSEKVGSFILGVTVKDEREERTVEIPFVIQPRDSIKKQG